MPIFSKDKVGRGAVYLYLENLVVMVSAYVFWLVITKVTTPEVMGISATIVSLAAIITTVINMGIPTSIQLFLGRTLASHARDSRTYIVSSIALLAILVIISTIVILLIKGPISQLLDINLDLSLVILLILLMSSSAVATLFRGIIISSLDTKILATAMVYSTGIKFTLSLVLLFLGMGAVGLTIAMVCFSVSESVLMGISVKRILSGSPKGETEISLRASIRSLLAGGMANWVPALLTVLGSQLGTILVFGSSGPDQAGYYFIAFSIYTGIAAAMKILFSITYPVLCSLDEGRRSLTYRAVKLSLLTTIPFSYSIIFFSFDIMKIFGHSYVYGSPALQILLISMMPFAITTGITNLVYALSNYRYTLIIGMATSIPRTVLYFILVPTFGGLGAALSFTIGSVAGLVLSIIISRKVNMSVNWKEIFAISVIPTCISYIFSLLEINYVISIVSSIVLTYVIYIKLHIVKRLDIHDSLKIFPKNIAGVTTRVVDSVVGKLDSSY